MQTCIVRSGCRKLDCVFSIWFNDDAGKVKSPFPPLEEVELLEDAQHMPHFPRDCAVPRDIECRTVDTHEFSNETADAATCDVGSGLRCANRPNTPRCHDYEVRFLCCRLVTVPCPTTVPPEPTTKGN